MSVRSPQGGVPAPLQPVSRFQLRLECFMVRTFAAWRELADLRQRFARERPLRVHDLLEPRMLYEPVNKFVVICHVLQNALLRQRQVGLHLLNADEVSTERLLVVHHRVCKRLKTRILLKLPQF